MTDAARNLYADLTAIPSGFWLALAAVAVVGYLLARWSEPLDAYTLRQEDPEAPDVCGATDGDLYCTLRPHAGDLHLDETRGTQYHSATFRGGEVAPAACACGHPSDDHDDEGACMHLCDCAWPIPPHTSCTDCASPAEVTDCRADTGDRCGPCHVATCAVCQDDLADQAAAESRFEGRWS